MTRIPLPLALQVFALLPVGASVFRIGQLMGSAANDTPFELAIHAQPSVFVLHILAASVFAIVGAFQVTKGPRGPWHKRLGYLAWAGGMVMAGSGIWLVLGFPVAEGSVLATQAVRFVFGVVLLWLLADGLCAAIKRDIQRHRAQMVRAYALGVVSTTTNLVIFGIWAAFMGDMTAEAFTGLLALGWVCALLGAELWLRRGRSIAQPA